MRNNGGLSNHRVLTYKVLKAIREYITGDKFNSININATIQRVSIKNIKDKNDSDYWEL